MAFANAAGGDDLFDRIDANFQSLPALLDAVMRAVAARVAPRGGALWLRDVGTLVIGHHGGQTATDWLAEAPAPTPGSIDATVARQIAPAPARAGAGDQLYPIGYAGATLGTLCMDFAEPPAPADAVHALLRDVAAQIGPLAKRFEVRRWSEARLGRPMMLIGLSRPIRAIERFIEIAARGNLPVLLRGEFGTEKAQIAASIHCCGGDAAGPFVQVDCAEPQGSPGQWIDRAAGGTLYLADIDLLDAKLQRQLPQYLPSRLGHWLEHRGDPPVRIVASTTGDLHQLAAAERFSRTLLAEIDYLAATVPPLRERADDLDALIAQALARNGWQAGAKRSDALLALCKAHHWPENLFELDRVIARLAVMTDARPIARRDILEHAPALCAAAGDDEAAIDGEEPVVRGADAARWIRATLGGAADRHGLHEALARALAHIGRHFADAMTIGQLAWAAGVSPSHLSFLFRSGIGMSFKTLLTHVRIHKACELLRGDARRPVTDVALSVGFADLSHFERSFRRIVGQPPRAFRRAGAVGC